ncbi:MAG: cyclic nucleotide-binding domain-containing protein [Gammaproteobacteria bacterium]|jgi:CRP-like cAMP-binding protein|nr:cyclic nucleotide-binding domain-containing protein [Gammaproteobacteria bacterium]MBT4196717.1 cyclic nucleotide-binding domain-containing protein [Gammaproteobacteria bacterium]MBT4448250.1 cyclic nucleotide-binding domain-containing protein [Gammaproteobacteria bacterium]MBT4863336.1 cyclic nucleotide-binding domain-containing protein [Gammaproteobacteria bacterium]MBT6457889.1 cyclic nucleotide-binding domain-containing protein [Gammaproteobacteria bacterium]
MQYFDYNENDSESSAAENITVFSGLSEDEWQMIIQNSRSIEFSPGDLLLKAGESDDALYIMVSGDVEVVSTNSFGFVKKIASISEGSVFGELAFFDSKPRSASIRAISRGQVLRISRQGFDQIAAWNPKLAQQFLFDVGRILAYRFRNESPYKI